MESQRLFSSTREMDRHWFCMKVTYYSNCVRDVIWRVIQGEQEALENLYQQILSMDNKMTMNSTELIRRLRLGEDSTVEP